MGLIADASLTTEDVQASCLSSFLVGLVVVEANHIFDLAAAHEKETFPSRPIVGAMLLVVPEEQEAVGSAVTVNHLSAAVSLVEN